MLYAHLSKLPDPNPEWQGLESVRVGLVPECLGLVPECHSPCMPDRFVALSDDCAAVLRIEVFSYGNDDIFAFEEAIIWQGMILIGLGNHVHVVSIDDKSVVSIDLGFYFGYFYPYSKFVLIASGERLFRLQPDRTVLWISEPLGIDGVIVHEVSGDRILGEGEWDPPGGWKPFAISINDGKHTRETS